MTNKEIENKMKVLEQFGCFWGEGGKKLRIEAKNELKSATSPTQLDNIARKYIKEVLDE